MSAPDAEAYSSRVLKIEFSIKIYYIFPSPITFSVLYHKQKIFRPFMHTYIFFSIFHGALIRGGSCTLFIGNTPINFTTNLF